eukprot:4866882-Pleurochrysis_carterae.AAC.7
MGPHRFWVSYYQYSLTRSRSRAQSGARQQRGAADRAGQALSTAAYSALRERYEETGISTNISDGMPSVKQKAFDQFDEQIEFISSQPPRVSCAA